MLTVKRDVSEHVAPADQQTSIAPRQILGSDMLLPNIVIVGGGFGGLATAMTLVKVQAQITLIDKHNYHCFQPLLYQVATASLAAPEVAWPIRSILASQTNVDVVLNEVSDVDMERRVVACSDGHLYPFDYLVIASGATHGYFDHPDWERYAPGLKTIEDAMQIRSKLLKAFEKADAAETAERQADLMTFVIIGGGPTGVEMAGSIADIARNIVSHDFRHINPSQAKVLLIEAGPRLLSTFPEHLSRYAQNALERMGVVVMLGSSVQVCDQTGVTLSNGTRIESEFAFWAAGVRASPAARWLKQRGDRAGRVPVNDRLEVPGLQNVFVIGDTASVVQEGKLVPGIAPAAKQMGAYVGSLIACDVAGESGHAPFSYKHTGDLAAIGRASAIVKLGRMELTGYGGWIFWGIAHIYFLIERRSRLVVALSWLLEFMSRKRGARLISTS